MKGAIVRKPLLVVFVCVTAAFLFFVWQRLPKPAETPEALAKEAIVMFERGDYDTLVAHVSREEKRLLDLDGTAFAELVERIYKPNTIGFKPQGEIELAESLKDSAVAVRTYRHDDGRTYQLLMVAASGPDGPEIDGLVYFVRGAAVSAASGGSSVVDSSPEASAKTLTSMAPVLASLRLRGVCLLQGGKYHFKSWDEVIREAQARASNR